MATKAVAEFSSARTQELLNLPMAGVPAENHHRTMGSARAPLVQADSVSPDGTHSYRQRKHDLEEFHERSECQVHAYQINKRTR